MKDTDSHPDNTFVYARRVSPPVVLPLISSPDADDADADDDDE